MPVTTVEGVFKLGTRLNIKWKPSSLSSVSIFHAKPNTDLLTDILDPTVAFAFFLSWKAGSVTFGIFHSSVANKSIFIFETKKPNKRSKNRNETKTLKKRSSEIENDHDIHSLPFLAF